jgi:hypothetical protein
MRKSGKVLRLADEKIANKIYYIRGYKVMLDKDLAELYGVKPIRLREQVKRNLRSFPAHFMFRLTKKETEVMVSQIAIPSMKHLGGSLPYAFTEHGILMLANILKSEKAIAVSIRLIEIFVKMRGMLSAHKDILLKIEQLERRSVHHEEDIQSIFEALKKLVFQPEAPRQRIGFRQKDDND